MSAIDRYLRNNSEFRTNEGRGALPLLPSSKIAIVTCMDSRLDVFAALGIAEGEAHVIRNAGGIVTDDVLRSLIISQRMLRTESVMLIHHTNCGMETFDDDAFASAIAQEAGEAPPFAFQAFKDLDQDVRDGIRRVRTCLFLPHRSDVRGFVIDVGTGRLREVLERPAEGREMTAP